MAFTLKSGLDVEEQDRLRVAEGLKSFNRSQYPMADHHMIHIEPFAVIAHDNRGEIVGGLLGDLGWGWLFIKALWVDGPARGAGLGSAILQRAERDVLASGNVGVYLDTVDTQAPAFYRRHGYEELGVLRDYPPGGKLHFFKKQLRRS